MQTQEDKLSKSLSGIAGEYFVAAELSRRGLIAAITLRNSRGTDILVTRPGGKKSASIQVKTNQSGNKEWILNQSDEHPKGENHYYVFVALNGREGQPEYYIVGSDDVATFCHDDHQEWLKGTKRDGTPHKDTTIRVFWPRKDSRDDWNRIKLD